MAGKRLRRVILWVRTKFSSLVSAIGTKIKLILGKVNVWNGIKIVLKYIRYIIIGCIILISSLIILSFIPEFYKVCLDYIPGIKDISFLKESTSFKADFSISSILEIAALAFVAWQISSARKNLFIENDLKTGGLLSLYLPEIIFRLENPNISVSGNISDEECRKFMHKAAMLLNKEKPEEKELIDCLNRYKTDNLINIPKWIEDINTCGKKVIDKYKK
jgi:hypothetical protein